MDGTANPTADWERVGDRYYRKVKLYESVFDQDLELENYVVTGAPFGGAIGTRFPPNGFEVELISCPLALYRDEEKLHTYRGTAAAKSSIDIYSCSGKLLRRINVSKRFLETVREFC